MQNIKRLILTIFALGVVIACSGGGPTDYSEFSNQQTTKQVQLPQHPSSEPQTPKPQVLLSKALTQVYTPFIYTFDDCPHSDGGSSQVRDCHGIQYNGGPVMSAPINVYLVWYGAWKDKTSQHLIEEFVSNFAGSDYWQINRMYCDSTGSCVSGNMKLAGETSRADFLHVPLSGGDIITIVLDSLGGDNAFPSDPNGIYLVLTSSEIPVDGSCTGFCGWHYDLSFHGTVIKYGFIQDAAACPESCSGFTADTHYLPPNGNVSGDGTINIIAHEVSEMATDPEITAWLGNEMESSDMCAWNYPKAHTTSNGGTANVSIHGRDYLLQGQWVLSGSGYCSVDTGAKP